MKRFKPIFHYIVPAEEKPVFALVRDCHEWTHKVQAQARAPNYTEIQAGIPELVSYIDTALADAPGRGPNVSRSFTIKKQFYWRDGYAYDTQKLALLAEMYTYSTASPVLYTMLPPEIEPLQQDVWLVSAYPDVFLCCDDLSANALGILVNIDKVRVWWTADRWFGIVIPVTPDGRQRAWRYSLPQQKTSLYVPYEQLAQCPLKPEGTVDYSLVFVEPHEVNVEEQQIAKTKSLAEQAAAAAFLKNVELQE
jgi:hypothetical protein